MHQRSDAQEAWSDVQPLASTVKTVRFTGDSTPSAASGSLARAASAPLDDAIALAISDRALAPRGSSPRRTGASDDDSPAALKGGSGGRLQSLADMASSLWPTDRHFLRPLTASLAPLEARLALGSRVSCCRHAHEHALDHRKWRSTERMR